MFQQTHKLVSYFVPFGWGATRNCYTVYVANRNSYLTTFACYCDFTSHMRFKTIILAILWIFFICDVSLSWFFVTLSHRGLIDGVPLW